MALNFSLNDTVWSRPPHTCKGDTNKLHELRIIRACDDTDPETLGEYTCVNKYGQSDIYKEDELFASKDDAISAFFEFTELS